MYKTDIIIIIIIIIINSNHSIFNLILFTFLILFNYHHRHYHHNFVFPPLPLLSFCKKNWMFFVPTEIQNPNLILLSTEWNLVTTDWRGIFE